MIDGYTKVCLTVIAVSLAVIGLRELPFIGPALEPDFGVLKIAICDAHLEGACATIGTIADSGWWVVDGV